MPLEPEVTVGKVLISTTSRFVGEYRAKDWVLVHAWPDFGDYDRMSRGLSENQLCRNFFVVSFTIPPPSRDGKMLEFPDCSALGGAVCACLSVLFGKRFDNLGCFAWNRGTHY